MQCREACAACCIAPSITQALPNMPNGKPADVPCANLDMVTFRCKIWGKENYPSFCHRFLPELSICGESQDEALEKIRWLEQHT